MFDMITIGDIKLDTFVVLPEASVHCQLKMPECLLCLTYGKKIPVKVVDSQIAGSAPNVAVGLSRMGMKTAVVSVMGQDSIRKLALEILKREGVSKRFLTVDRGVKSAYSVVLNYAGEKTILTQHIPCSYQLPAVFSAPQWLYISELGAGYEDLYKQAIAFVKRTRCALGFNPGAIQIQDRRKVMFDLMAVSSVLFTNLEEAQAISKETTLEIHRLASALYAFGPKLVVITNGKEGAYVFNGVKLSHCPIFPGKLVEATGAGDAFATGFIGSLMHGHLEEEALRWGSVNATSAVAFVGPQKGLLSAGQIRSRLRRASKSFRTNKL